MLQQEGGAAPHVLRRPGATVRRVQPAVPERDGVLRQAAQSPSGRSEPFKGQAALTFDHLVCHRFLDFYAGFSSEFIFLSQVEPLESLWGQQRNLKQ